MGWRNKIKNMMPRFIRESIDFVFQNDLYNKIPDDDLLTKQRYRLYGIFTLAGIIICLLVAAQAFFILKQTNLILWSLLFISAAFAINYFLLLRHKNMNVAFSIAILSG